MKLLIAAIVISVILLSSNTVLAKRHDHKQPRIRKPVAKEVRSHSPHHREHHKRHDDSKLVIVISIGDDVSYRGYYRQQYHRRGYGHHRQRICHPRYYPRHHPWRHHGRRGRHHSRY